MFSRNDRAVFLGGDPTQSDRLSNKYRNAFGLHLVHDLNSVTLDSPLTDVELQRNCLAGKTFYHTVHDLRFSRCETAHTSPQLLDRSLAQKVIKRASQTSINSCE